ncbi:MAG: hypothetical protein ABIB55_01100 [Candidatus Nealsonbacteria bacterium]
MQPKTPPVGWDNFYLDYPASSVAIDGFVSGPPKLDAEGRHANFNHHEGVSRLETRATCAQVLMAIKMGFFDIFGSGVVGVYANHCDEDCCLSWFLLEYGRLTEIINSPNLERLVVAEDLFDTTGGMYPFPADSLMLEKMAWIFSPYRQFKLSGKIDEKETADYLTVVQEISERIQQYILGRGKSLTLDLRYEKKIGGPGWFFIKEIGAQAKRGMALDGIKAFVTVRETRDGKWVYTVERASKFIPFHIFSILSALNRAEGRDDADEDRWGGSSDRGGSPRVSASSLSPKEVAEVINSII